MVDADHRSTTCHNNHRPQTTAITRRARHLQTVNHSLTVFVCSCSRTRSLVTGDRNATKTAVRNSLLGPSSEATSRGFDVVELGASFMMGDVIPSHKRCS